MEDGVGRPSLVPRHQLQGKRFLLFQSPGLEGDVRRGSQHELIIDEVGDIIVRGGNPNAPNFGSGGASAARNGQLDHISFGISPEKRGLEAKVDTSTHDDIHVAAYKSYHTTTPNGYDLQISYGTHRNRLTLANAVKPKRPGGQKRMT
jgi:hypothetical protein